MSRMWAVPPIAEWGWIVVATGAAATAELGLRTVGLPLLSRVFGTPLSTVEDQPRASSATKPLSPAHRRRVRASLRVMRHWPFGDTCLRQALVAGAMVRSRGPELVLGVAKRDGEIRAHAWLEIDGAVLDPLGGATSYQRLTPASRSEGT